MSKQYITIHDIAKELNVSASTVSRALQDHPRISQATREAVKKLALQYNYQPSVVATSLRSGQSKTVGVIVPRINRNFFSNVIGGLEEILASSGYHLMICQTHEKASSEVDAIQTLINARVEAIMLSISMETKKKEHLQRVLDKGIRLFFFDRIAEGMEVCSVEVDDRLGAYLNVKHLLEQGYRRIAHVAGAGHITIYKARKEGYLQAMDESGIDVQKEWIMERPLIVEGGEEAFETGMRLKKPPDAYFCAGDFAALGVMQAAVDHGLNVPRDVGITGFANEPFTEYLHPSLTTVDQRGSEMGQKIAELFLDSGEEGSGPCSKEVLKPRLIIRESSLIIH